MATYNLTTLINTFSGGSGNDLFRGPAGGNDVLRGNGGNDFFKIQSGQTGVINGGAGYDKIHLIGNGYNELDAGLTITGVEKLAVDATNLYATVDQLDGFTKFDVTNNSDQFHFFLTGQGGTLNFASSYTEPQRLSIEAEMVTSAVNITGSARNDEMIGSDYSDALNGFKGNDRIYGGSGNDKINGSLGNDYLYGDDGKDAFLFNTRLGGGNFDHLGDFRPTDDSIRLDDAIFTWTGQSQGELAARNFKVIGNGQQVDANDRILYNEETGVISYDVDGRGGQAAVAFAVADNFAGDVPVLTHQDFFIV